jgi:hypothetical protein
MRRTVLAVAVLAVLVPAAPALADDPLPDPTISVDRNPPHTSGPDNSTPYWANNSLTGYCGQTDGGYVVAAQSFLRTWGTYPGRIDNYWGPQSHSALINYQRARGSLQVDGCAGPATWDDMQRRTRYVADSANCHQAPGSLSVYALRVADREAFFDRSSATRYWYADTFLEAVSPPVGEALYRFSDSLVVRC